MELKALWSVLRNIIRNNYSFAQIKDICGNSGLPIYELAHLQQKFSGGTSKGQLMDEIDKLYNRLPDSQKESVVKLSIKEIASAEKFRDELEDLLQRFGWGLSGNEPYPLEIEIVETMEMPEKVSSDISKCLRRYRDGDYSGAMTTICGIVDDLTEEIHKHKGTAFDNNLSYQNRVSNSFNLFEDEYKKNIMNLACMKKKSSNYGIITKNL